MKLMRTVYRRKHAACSRAEHRLRIAASSSAAEMKITYAGF
jgi:hypothetical protein